MNKAKALRDVDVVFFHQINDNIHCMDGISSAFVIWYHNSLKFFKNKIKFIGMAAGSQIDLKSFDPTGKNIIMVDVSVDLRTANLFKDKASSFLIVDHHQTAVSNLAAFDADYLHLDMTYSAAYLIWQCLFPNTPIPLFIQYVSARDIWQKHLLPNVDAFYESQRAFPVIPSEVRGYDAKLEYTFNEYLKLLDGNVVQEFIKAGLVRKDVIDQMVKESVKQAVTKFYKINGKYYLASGVCNTVGLQSDIGNSLLEAYPLADFSYVWHANESNGTTSFSYRSEKNKANVEEIARTFGGGGHIAASGSRSLFGINQLPTLCYNIDNPHELLEQVDIRQLYLNDVYYNVALLNTSSHGYHLAKYNVDKFPVDISICYRILKGGIQLHIVKTDLVDLSEIAQYLNCTGENTYMFEGSRGSLKDNMPQLWYLVFSV